MTQRFDYTGGGMQALVALEQYLGKSSIEESLVHLVKMRASQINGCAYCLDMHSKDARAIGDTAQRLYLLNAWHEARELYTEREQAALEWTENITKVAETHVPDEVYERVSKHFDEKELADLTYVIVAINAWNRLAISARTPTATYKPELTE